MKYIFTISILVFSINLFAQVPTNGLVAYYPFSGNANDYSGNNYNGVLHGPTLCVDRFGNSNHAYSFDGVNDYIDLSSYFSNFNFQHPATVSFWINTKYDTGMAIYALGDGANQLYVSGVFVGANTTGTLTNELIIASVQVTGSDKYITGHTTTNRGKLINTGWHNVVTLFNGVSTEIYLDDTLLSLTCNYGTNNGHYGNLPVSGVMTLGTRYANGFGAFFNGFLDDVRIYNQVLTPTEITSLYQETITNVETTKSSNSIKIYPNPTQGKVNIISDSIIKSVEVTNILNEVIYYGALNDSNLYTNIDISGYPNGVYFIKINDGKNTNINKFILY